MNSSENSAPPPSLDHPLDTLILDILRNHPDGIREYALYQELRDQGIPPFDKAKLMDSLVLFRVHFLLFHHLYRIRAALRAQQKGDLEIHTLSIRLLELETFDASVPETPDPLTDYYMDLSTLESTDKAAVDAMLDAFWLAFSQMGDQGEARKVLGVEKGASREEIQTRFRALAKQHHPDRGGSAEQFQRYSEAAATLLEREG
ncbi:MAG: DnaJ domain-containing protein [Magnetococcales bacterium]|nr:DnaJ domain-containing protein [Magnetococcales bacterium]